MCRASELSGSVQRIAHFMKKPIYPVLHLIGNAHLDPVWLWDRAEGMAEAVATVRTIVKLMQEQPELTFIRGESLVYEEVQRRDPVTFAAVGELVKSGRWDIVGGNYLQPDMNLPHGDTLARVFAEGQSYFRKNFGKTVRAGWSADCFGHSAGLPDILWEAGLRYYAFGRPAEGGEPGGMPAKNVFWWRGPKGSRVLAHRTTGQWYGCERGEVPQRLDDTLKWATANGRRHAAVFFGLGNHGGGPSQRQLDDIAAWRAAHPEVKVLYSGLHRFFGAMEKDILAGRLVVPEYAGELNFALRGVNSAGAKFKYAYRRAEAALTRAERAVQTAGTAKALPDAIWRGLMFNSFHDILPASCTEIALEQQIDEVRGLCHEALTHESDALVAMAAKLKPTVPAAPAPDHPQAVPFLIWNPLARPWSGLVEIEAGLDHRPLFGVADPELRLLGVAGGAQAFQVIPVGHNFMPALTWRRRVVTQVTLPALGAGVVSLGWVPGHIAPGLVNGSKPAHAVGKSGIANEWYAVRACVGAAGISASAGAKAWLREFTLLTVEDPWGPWGGHYEEPGSHALNTVRHKWKVITVAVVESGPLRAKLTVKLHAEGGASEADFTLSLEAGRRAVAVDARVFWHEENARLKLVFPVAAKRIEVEVPGAEPGTSVVRGEVGEGPGIGWVRALGGAKGFALGTDALSDFDLHRGAVQATVVRSSRYTQSEPATAQPEARGPVIDRGEYRFRFVITDVPNTIPDLSEELVYRPAVQMTWPR